MNLNREVLANIVGTQEYKAGVGYGKPRCGHAEGTVEAHIRDLLCNVHRLLSLPITTDEEEQLLILVHVHDTFKLWAKRDSPIEDPQSHSSLAAKCLSKVTRGEVLTPLYADLVTMVQYHDESYSFYQHVQRKGRVTEDRLQTFRRRMMSIENIELFTLFNIVDGYTPSKEHSRIRWFVDQLNCVLRDAGRTWNVQRIEKALELFQI